LLGYTGHLDYLNENQAVNTSHVWVEGNYVNIKHKDQVKYILVRDRLKNVYNHWQKYHFIQSHKSYLVNMKMIRQVSWNEISLSDGSKVPLSRTHKKEFQDAYTLFLKKNQVFDSI
jgi:DNA-binding LytR/AlgR family response regulator